MHRTGTTPGGAALRAALTAAAAVTAWACAGEGPAVEARSQTITFAPAPSPIVNQTSVTVSAIASSGLPVAYSSTTPSVCSVDRRAGVVTAKISGICNIAANQPGDTRYAPAPQVDQDVTFALGETLLFYPAPLMSLYDRASVTAVDNLGLSVSYATSTPSICSVEGSTGLVIALSTGDCTIVAGAGTLQEEQTIPISAPPGTTVPGSPAGIAASAGDTPGTATIRIGATAAGGSPIIEYSVASSPPGITASGPASPISVTCPSSCAGHRFSVTATNAVGTSAPSGAVDVVTGYRVVATFHEPDTQPNDSVFVGSFTLDATTGVVSGLRGRLSEAMTGGATPFPNDTMTWLSLEHQLSSVPVTLSGVSGALVTTFLLDTTDTLSSNATFGGTDGWSPGSGMGLYFGYPGANPGNAYVRIFVNTSEPTTALSQAQLDKLAYADCTPGGMMGASCMTGTTVAGYGTLGTMSGYPVSQTTTRE